MKLEKLLFTSTLASVLLILVFNGTTITAWASPEDPHQEIDGGYTPDAIVDSIFVPKNTSAYVYPYNDIPIMS
jgi:hypothetical protein